MEDRIFCFAILYTKGLFGGVSNNSSIYLRPITMKDTDLILKWRNDEDVKKYFIYQQDFTEEGHLRWMNTKVKNGSVIQFIIMEVGINNPVGSVYLQDVDYEYKKAEYGIFIGENSARGKGYGTQAAKLMLEYAFRKAKLHRVYLRAFADNIRAITSYEKAGFVLEGILRDDVYVRNEYRDIVWMAAINPEE